MDSVIDDIRTSFQRARMRYISSSLCGSVKLSTNGTAIYTNEHGGTKLVGDGPLTYTFGNTNQYRLSGKYSGVQCTSIALGAIIHQKMYPSLTPVGINTILDEGNKLHTRLRDDIKISENGDGKVAIEDFPYERYLRVGKVFGTETYVRLRRECEYVFTTIIDGFEAFHTIEEYITNWLIKRKRQKLGFLLTIGEYSHAVLTNEDGTAYLFDSHGHLSYKGKTITSMAGAVSFPSIKELSKFLINMYREGRHAAIALVSVRFPRQARRRVSKNTTGQAEYKPFCPKADDVTASYSLPEIQIEGEDVNENVKILDDEMTSPYVRLLGGGD